jgi:aerobic carbon-monoxide dehydrogenase large subunit
MPGLAAVANAIVDALTESGVEHIDLPATPERVWSAGRAGTIAAKEGSSSDRQPQR